MNTESQILSAKLASPSFDFDQLSERESIALIYSDSHKSAYGYRPHVNPFDLTTEELKAHMAEFQRVIKGELKRQKEEEKEAVKAFQANIDLMIQYGAENEEKALQWILDAEDFNPDTDHIDHFVWDKGLAHTEYGRQLESKLIKIIY